MAGGRAMRSQSDLLRGDHRATPLPPEALDALGADAPAITALIADLTALAPAARPTSAGEALARLEST